MNYKKEYYTFKHKSQELLLGIIIMCKYKVEKSLQPFYTIDVSILSLDWLIMSQQAGCASMIHASCY